MDTIFPEIKSRLAALGIEIKREDLARHHTQGFMSEVYGVPSSKGNLIIHIIRPVPEHVRNRVWNKLVHITPLLVGHPSIPNAEVLTGGRIGEQFFLVQKELPGTPAGRRTLEGLEVVDIWLGERLREVREIQSILADLHGIKVEGFGWPSLQDGRLVGRYGSWKEFLEAEAPLWLESIEQTDPKAGLKLPMSISLDRIKECVRAILQTVEDVSPALVHGDAINPGNILIKNGTVSGLLDWEWSIFADPAWEFSDPGWEKVIREENLDAYMEKVGADKEAFLRKIKLYRVLWNLWGTHLHSHIETNATELKLYQVLRNLLNKSIEVLPR